MATLYSRRTKFDTYPTRATVMRNALGEWDYDYIDYEYDYADESDYWDDDCYE